MTDDRAVIPPALRARLAANYAPVRPLPSPSVRVLWVLPFAILSLVAAQAVFQFRVDASRLGWTGTWGVSLAQVIVGVAIVAASLREAVPGRAWSRTAAALWLTLPIALVLAITFATWEVSPIRLRAQWAFVSGLCLLSSTVSALPIVALASVLAARAYPTRPLFAGALLGLGAGLIADAGWRLFCHFSEPAHVLVAHLGGVIVCVALGSFTGRHLSRQRFPVDAEPSPGVDRGQGATNRARTVPQGRSQPRPSR